VSDPQARLFVAADLPPQICAAAAGWRDQHARPDAGWRPLPDESLHVTLCFLGGRPEGEIEAIGAAVVAQAASAAGLSLGDPLLLPARRPRVMALEIGDPAGELVALQARVAAALEREFLVGPERRTFRPHVTVARARKDARPARAEPPLPPREEFAAAALTLYRSRLGPRGARYEAVESAPL
jgi:2'-5' RNA ligase